jgi:hypothetical protein
MHQNNINYLFLKKFIFDISTLKQFQNTKRINLKQKKYFSMKNRLNYNPKWSLSKK